MVSKVLSICMHGRNDNYGGNFAYHLSLMLNYLAANLAVCGSLDDVEVVITDWNSPAPLATGLTLTEAACSMTRFVEVDAETARQHNYKDTDYHTSIAQNVSLRRAVGRYLLFCPADILFTVPVLENLLGLLKGTVQTSFSPDQVGMGIMRKFIPNTVMLPPEPNRFDDIDRYLLENDHKLRTGRMLPGLFSGLGAIVMPRSIYEELRGFTESLGGWGYQDIELGLRVNMRHGIVDLSHHGIVTYDFEPSEQFKQTKAGRINDMPRITECSNDEDWGLGRYELTETRAVPASFSRDCHKRPLPEISLPACDREAEGQEVLDALLTASRYAAVVEFFGPDATFSLAAARHNNACAIHQVLAEAAEGVFVPKISIETSTLLDEAGHKGEVHFHPGLSVWHNKSDEAGFDVAVVHLESEQATTSVLESALDALAPGGVLIAVGEAGGILNECAIEFDPLGRVHVARKSGAEVPDGR
ncbi:hypothetical protein [uncultured Pseudodesulfovibrio sp.]|uniref:hypothetical protein n=1 Tax=uncultured Pseudodesulfovibrio sp. TaxID=2035858 RepID=UPI0029C68163|nr:hypothetical protein [uncultured Pseudodesulfovibrio sp.]